VIDACCAKDAAGTSTEHTKASSANRLSPRIRLSFPAKTLALQPFDNPVAVL
jgi:hypothetical protein